MYKGIGKRWTGCKKPMDEMWIKLSNDFLTGYSQGYEQCYTQLIHINRCAVIDACIKNILG